MSILIPTPVPSAPYPLVNDALNLARTRINDAIQSIGGEMLTNTQPFTQVMCNGAWNRMQKFLASMGYSRVRQRAVLTGFPVVGSQDPASQCILNWSFYFDGVSYWAPPNVPVLPPDLIAPLRISERQSSGFQATLTSGYTGFRPMQLTPDGNYNCRKQCFNGWFDWRGDDLIMPGATMPIDFEIFYSAMLPAFNTIGQIPWYQQSIPIIQGDSALAHYICREFAVGRGDMDAQSWETAGQQDCRELLNTSDVPLKQRFNVSRRSYRGGHGGGNTGSYGYGGL
jgi:hypothetical protein